jgi:hypothetical protein
MAVTTQYSTEYNTAHVDQTGNNPPTDMHGRVRCAFFTCNQDGAGDATSSVALCKLPGGKVRLLASQSKAYVNWTTGSATLDLGWDAYTNAAGTAVAADPNGIDDGVDVDTAGFQTFGSALTATGGTKVFESEDGVVIRATSQDVALADDSDLVGYLLYVVD